MARPPPPPTKPCPCNLHIRLLPQSSSFFSRGRIGYLFSEFGATDNAYSWWYLPCRCVVFAVVVSPPKKIYATDQSTFRLEPVLCHTATSNKETWHIDPSDARLKTTRRSRWILRKTAWEHCALNLSPKSQTNTWYLRTYIINVRRCIRILKFSNFAVYRNKIEKHFRIFHCILKNSLLKKGTE